MDDFFRDCIKDYCQQRQQQRGSDTKKQPFVVLGLGTYCGYSAIRMLRTMTQIQQRNHVEDCNTDSVFDFHIISVDVNAAHQAVAQQLLQAAGFSSSVSTFLLLNEDDDDDGVHASSSLSSSSSKLVSMVQGALQALSPSSILPTINFVFMDHAKVRQLWCFAFVRCMMVQKQFPLYCDCLSWSI